jgi:mRNA interferase MazF
MGRRVNRGEVWLSEVGGKRRPVLVITRSDVLDVRSMVTVAEVTTSMRGNAVEVPIDHATIGIDRPSVVNCDSLHTVRQSALTTRLGAVDANTLRQVCSAVNYALDC